MNMTHIIDCNNINQTDLKNLEALGAYLLIDKPFKWPSFRLIKKLRYLTKIKKIGHTGTLDPLATGLMILAIGRKATKNINRYIKLDKTYRATIKLGEITDSYDLETLPQPTGGSYTHITEVTINKTLKQFVGKLNQIPSKFSAIKKDGKRMYELARKGIDVEIAARNIYIEDIHVEKIELPFVTLHISCSSGTYIRSMANDIGHALGCGGYLFDLVRTKIGDFELNNAIKWEQIEIHFTQKG